MEFVSDITGVLLLAAEGGEEEGGAFLVTPGSGVMIWTVLAFGFTMVVLSKARLPADPRGARGAGRDDQRRHRRRREAAPGGRRAARGVPRAPQGGARAGRRHRRPGQEVRRQRQDRVRSRRAAPSARSCSRPRKKDIEAETRRSLEQIRKEIADLTVLATEQVTRSRSPRTIRSGSSRRRSARSTSRPWPATRRSASERADGGDQPRLQRGPVRGRPGEGQARRGRTSSSARLPTRSLTIRDLQVFFFSPYFSSNEKRDGISQGDLRRRAGARQLPRAARREAPDAGAVPDPAPLRRALGEGEQAARGDGDERRRARSSVVESVGAEIEKQTGQTIELKSEVDPSIIGGLKLQVGNMVLDASIRNRLEKLRREVAQAA